MSVKDIQKIESERRRARKETYTEILKQFDKKIRYAVEVGDRQVFLSTPNMLLGYPLYNVTSATVYLARQLRHLGYHVQEIGGPNLPVPHFRNRARGRSAGFVSGLDPPLS